LPKTDDRIPRQEHATEGEEATVVRLSDWLAPDHELVPFGPRAHAQAAGQDAAAGLAEAPADQAGGSGFWDGDTSVHTAVPGPGMLGEFDEPTVGRRRHRRALPAWHPRLPRLQRPDWPTRLRAALAELAARISWRWVAVGSTVLAVAVVVLVISFGGGSPERSVRPLQAGLDGQPQHIGTAALAAASASTEDVSLTHRATLNTLALGTAARHAWAARVQRHPPVRAASVQVSHTPISTSAPADITSTAATQTATNPAPTETEPAQTTTTAPSSGGGGGGSTGGSSTTQKQPAFGSSGALGPGSSPDS
jgi:hypothetical protein